jgi:membrane associated rhomboid family serine protease
MVSIVMRVCACSPHALCRPTSTPHHPVTPYSFADRMLQATRTHIVRLAHMQHRLANIMPVRRIACAHRTTPSPYIVAAVSPMAAVTSLHRSILPPSILNAPILAHSARTLHSHGALAAPAATAGSGIGRRFFTVYARSTGVHSTAAASRCTVLFRPLSPSSAWWSAPRRFHSTGPRDDSREFVGWNHHVHGGSDARGETSRNPHYSAYLELPSPLLGGGGSPFKPFTWTLIGLNVIVWACWLYAGVERVKGNPEVEAFMLRNFTATLTNLREGRVWTLITAGFSHQATWHLAINMMVLNMFAPVLMIHTGIGRFMILYLGGAAMSSIAHIVYTNFISPRLGGHPRLMPDFRKNGSIKS